MTARHPDPSGAVWLSSAAVLFTIVTIAWAGHHKTATIVIVGTVLIASVAAMLVLGCDLYEQRNEAEARAATAQQQALTAADDAIRWAEKYAVLERIHHECETSPKPHLRVIQHETEA